MDDMFSAFLLLLMAGIIILAVLIAMGAVINAVAALCGYRDTRRKLRNQARWSRRDETQACASACRVRGGAMR